MQKYNNIKWTKINYKPGLVASYDTVLEMEWGYSQRKGIEVNKKGKCKQEKNEASYKKQKEASDVT